jgi:hypothetical protein
MKKHDKVSSFRASDQILPVVADAYFCVSPKLQTILNDIEVSTAVLLSSPLAL